MDSGHCLCDQGSCGLNKGDARPGDQRHLACVHRDAGELSWVRLTANTRHDPVFRTEAHHHAEALTGCKHECVAGVSPEPRSGSEEAPCDLRVGIACDSAQLEHSRTIEDRGKANTHHEAGEERLALTEVLRHVEVHSCGHLLHADTGEAASESCCWCPECLPEVPRHDALGASRVLGHENPKTIKRDARHVGQYSSSDA
mmetsp:Transcript_92865/g.207513  ORF Transcript_92865/g.207513 Transcript_92865/m.207513 type:complete len:200 (-) Transcript_92865:112-711(-)